MGLQLQVPGWILKDEYNGTLYRHVHLGNGRARQVYKNPAPLIKTILKGLRKELLYSKELSTLISQVAGPVPDEPEAEIDWSTYKESGDGKVYYDSNIGAEFDPAQGVETRKDKLEGNRRQQVFKKDPFEEYYSNTGHGPISLKWVDRNKGDNERPNYRSRLVAREIQRSAKIDNLPEHESFSAMSP